MVVQHHGQVQRIGQFPGSVNALAAQVETGREITGCGYGTAQVR